MHFSPYFLYQSHSSFRAWQPQWHKTSVTYLPVLWKRAYTELTTAPCSQQLLYHRRGPCPKHREKPQAVPTPSKQAPAQLICSLQTAGQWEQPKQPQLGPRARTHQRQAQSPHLKYRNAVGTTLNARQLRTRALQVNTAEMDKAKCCDTSLTKGIISKYILVIFFFFTFTSNFSVWVSKATVWKGHVDVSWRSRRQWGRGSPGNAGWRTPNTIRKLKNLWLFNIC